MKIDERIVIQAPIEDVWKLITDVPRVGSCLPGVESVTELGDGRYGGAVRVKVGAIAVRLEGKVALVVQDDANHTAVLEIEASDQRIRGSIRGKTQASLVPAGVGATEMLVSTDAAVLGKLGQFGQAVIEKKTRQILEEFVARLGSELQPAQVGAPAAERLSTEKAESAGAASAGVAGTPTYRAASPAVAQTSATGRRVGPVMACAGLVIGLLAASRREPEWSVFGLSLVICGSSQMATTR